MGMGVSNLGGLVEVIANSDLRPVEISTIDRVSPHGEAYCGVGGFAILRGDEDDLND